MNGCSVDETLVVLDAIREKAAFTPQEALDGFQRLRDAGETIEFDTLRQP